MKMTLKKVVTLLLTVALVFGVSSTTVLAIGDSADSNSGGTNVNQTPDGSVGGHITTEWCKIDYDENGIVVALNPTAEALLSTNVNEIKAVLKSLIGAVKEIVVESIKDQMFGDSNDVAPDDPDDDVEIEAGTNQDNIWEAALKTYITEEYGSAETENYVKFLKDLLDADKMDDGADAPFEKFTAYVLKMLKSAVKFGDEFFGR